MSATYGRVSIPRLILVPALISLAVTILRLIGELQNWSPVFFNRAPGGPLAIVGIWWLAIVFGVYFAFKLIAAGEGPRSKAAALLFAVLGVPVAYVGLLVRISAGINVTGKSIVSALFIVGAAILPLRGWPALGKTLLAYAYAARIPVLIVMYIAIQKNWGTHYDVVPPNTPAFSSTWDKFVQIAFFPQMFLWIAYTVIVGVLAGTLAVAIFRRGAAGSVAGAPA
jgi:hypothetical protein